MHAFLKSLILNIANSNFDSDININQEPRNNLLGIILLINEKNKKA